MAFVIPLLFLGGVGFGTYEGVDAIVKTVEWNKKKICSSSPQKPQPKDDTDMIQNCLDCSNNNYSACARLGRNTLSHLMSLPMQNNKSRRIYKGLATGQSLQIGDMLVSADYQYVMFFAPLDKDGNGVLLFYNGLIQNPNDDFSWYDTTLSTPFFQGKISGGDATYRAGGDDQPAKVENWGAQIVMFAKNDTKGAIVFSNTDTVKLESYQSKSTREHESELQNITSQQAVDRQRWTMISYTFVLPGSFVPINSSNSSVIYGKHDLDIAQRLTLKQLAAAIMKYQKDPDVYKSYNTDELSIMGLNPQMAKGKDGATYLTDFSDGGDGVYWSKDTFTGWVPSQSANGTVAGTPANTEWSVEATKPNPFWRVHAWTAFYLSAQNGITSLGSEPNIPKFASGTYFGSSVSNPTKTLTATVPTGVSAAATFETCVDLETMSIPQCTDNNVYTCTEDAPYACYRNKARSCPTGYTKSDVTCQTSGVTYNMCRRDKTYTQLYSPDNLFACCSGKNLSGTKAAPNGAANCPSAYCGKFSQNQANDCPNALKTYCEKKAKQYPKFKGTTMGRSHVTKLTNSADSSTVEKSIVKNRDYQFLSTAFPGCGCFDKDLISIAKKAYDIQVQTSTGTVDIHTDASSTPDCWFKPCRTANNNNSLKDNSCTLSYCAAVQGNVLHGNSMIDKNSCTARATTKNTYSNVASPTSTTTTSNSTSTPASTTPASSTSPATTPASPTSPATTPASTAASTKATSKKSPYTKYFIYGGVGLGTLFIILMLLLIFRS